MGNILSAFADDALGYMDAVGVAEAIAAGKISAQEAAQAAITRAEKVNTGLNAIAFKTYETALARASQQPQGALWGVPTFVKDNEALKGAPTQFGTGTFKARPAQRNTRYVEQFLATGLNPIGKSTMPEFGLICSTENPNWGITRNPWNTDYTTGGSSSGSAAMVASGVVPIAMANDGAGSIRIPASCCGLVGLKPSRERLINAEGIEMMPLNIIHEGVVTRTVRDTAAFLASAEKYYRNPALPELGMVSAPVKKRLKVVFFDNISPGKIGHQDEDTRTVISSTAKLLASLGHEVDMAPFPFEIDNIKNDFLNYYGLMAFFIKNFGGYLLKVKMDKSKLEPFTHGLSSQFRRNIFSLRKNIRILKETGHGAEEHLFKKYDVIMTPTLAHKVPQIGYFPIDLPYEQIADRVVRFASFTGMQNITGSPTISLPMGQSAEGLPIGLQFIAPMGNDRLLLELAYELEEAQPWKLLHEFAAKEVAN